MVGQGGERISGEQGGRWDHPKGGMTIIPDPCVLLNSLVLTGVRTEN